MSTIKSVAIEATCRESLSDDKAWLSSISECLLYYFVLFSIYVEKTMDPRVKPEDDKLKSLFLFVIPAGLTGIQYYDHFITLYF